MLRKGSVGLLRQALQFGLQQPVQQSCVQLQVLSLQAVRFKSKQSMPKARGLANRAQNLDSMLQRALDRATAAKYAGAEQVPVTPPAFPTPSTQTAAAAAAADGSAAAATGEPAASAAAESGSPADTESSSSSSSNSSSNTPSNEGDSSSSSDSSTWQPSWMRSLRGMIRGDSGRRRPRAKASPLTPLAATQDTKQAEQQEERQKEQQQQLQQQTQEDGWGQMLATTKDLSMDDYAQQLANDPKSDDFERPPRPMTPIRGPRANYQNAFDYARVQFLRHEAHHSMIVAMSQTDKLRIKLNPALHRDPAALKQLASATSYPIDMVRDLCEQFHEQRRKFQLMHKHHSAGGNMPPLDDVAQHALLHKKLRNEDREERLKELLAGRDIKACHLRNVTTEVLLDPRALMKRKCPQTQLTYAQCCGRKSRLNLKATLKAKAAKRGVYEAT